MDELLTIGDFARMTLLSVKTLRRYQEIGLLEPLRVDPDSGYRYYSPGQVPIAQVVRRFRDLGMPLAELTQLVHAPDVAARNRTIAAHLRRMEGQLEHTRTTVASLRRLMDGPPAPAVVTFRAVSATRALAIRARLGEDTGLGWIEQTHRVLRAALATMDVHRVGPDSALFAPEIFEADEGEVTAYIPVDGHLQDWPGHVELTEIPATELAVVEHVGPVEDLDQAYAALGRVVSEQSIGVAGPLREHYLIGPCDTSERTTHRTEVGWPVFRTTEHAHL